ncbi:MAG: RDD family protein [Saprospiraceae bacterium]
MSELAIRSPTNVSINYQLAPLLERSLAFIIDFVIIMIVSQLISFALGVLLVWIVGDDGYLNLFLGAFLPIILFMCYFALGEYFFEGQTVGKRALGLRTIRLDGAPPTFETYGLRSAMLLLDFILCFGTGAIGLLAAASSPLNQRVGDRIAQTVVIRTNARSLYQLNDILNIKTTDDHQVMYPNAIKLDIQQALIIKEVMVKWETRRANSLKVVINTTANRVAKILELEVPPQRQLEFLRQVLRDYIVLTR